MTRKKENLKEAVLWQPAEGAKVRCGLCNFRCTISDGSVGRCRVRKNIGGRLYSLNYDKLCAANIDPIEKKPLFHFQPGSASFSVAAVGCNFRCDFCQNWQISQPAFEEGSIDGQRYEPDAIVKAAVKSSCKSIAYTYTEPTVFMELCADCGELARQKGLANVFVSNGFMTKQAIDFAAGWLDGINIDLKSFSEDFYRDRCKAALKPVLDNIEYIAKQTDIWMEVTTLVVPGQNDSEEELKKIAEFLVAKAGPDIPWHVSRFYPNYRMGDTAATPTRTLEKAFDIGRQVGLRYIYIGNLPPCRAESTYCYNCGAMLIERAGYRILRNDINDGRCPGCGADIAGYGLP